MLTSEHENHPPEVEGSLYFADSKELSPFVPETGHISVCRITLQETSIES